MNARSSLVVDFKRDLLSLSVCPPPACPVLAMTWSSFLISPRTGPPLPYTDNYTCLTQTMVMFCRELGDAVLSVNYSGATGYGEENAMSLLRDMGGCCMTQELCLEKYSHLSMEKCVLRGGFLLTLSEREYPEDLREGESCQNISFIDIEVLLKVRLNIYY